MRKTGKNENQASFDGQALKHRRRVRNYEGRSHRRLCYWLCIAGVGVMTAALSYSGVRLALYVGQNLSAKEATETLRREYHEQEELPGPTAAQISGREEVATNGKLLPKQAYSAVDSRLAQQFAELRRQNRDIIGWVTIDGLLDEPVMQRDNDYYLRRDYRGYHNVNGAIFADQDCDFRTRPYTVRLYGHNMKTELRFGGLHRYDDPDYYRANPFVTFDTAYERGRYVIFAVITASLERGGPNYLDLSKLNAATIAWREEAIGELQQRSRYSPVIDVRAEDQILLLITCVAEDKEERRIIAARRIRPDETEAEALKRIQKTHRQ